LKPTNLFKTGLSELLDHYYNIIEINFQLNLASVAALVGGGVCLCGLET
jgi:hypothetical protein